MRINEKGKRIFDTEDELAEIKYFLENEDVKALDLNSDGEINEDDVTALKKFLANASGEDINRALADVNGDGVVNVRDIAALKKKIQAYRKSKEAE